MAVVVTPKCVSNGLVSWGSTKTLRLGYENHENILSIWFVGHRLPFYYESTVSVSEALLGIGGNCEP